MYFAIATTFFFALSGIFIGRVLRFFNIPETSCWRLFIAGVILGSISSIWGAGFGGKAFFIFFISGVAGFGVGDMAYMATIKYLGPRLGVLLVQCLAAPVAALSEWLWLGTRLSNGEIFSIAMILGGVAIALMPEKEQRFDNRTLALGILAGLVGALGVGWGAVLSRRGFERLLEVGTSAMDPIDSSFERILGGLCFSILALLWTLRKREERKRDHYIWGKIPVLLGASITGPVLGMICYQGALRALPSGVVMPIVATVPIVIIPFTWYFEGERPTGRSISGGMVAVLGVITMSFAHR